MCISPYSLCARVCVPLSSSSSSSVSPFPSSSTLPEDRCVYSSYSSLTCENGECHEETNKFRKCVGRPRERAVTDPNTREERWVPDAAAAEDQSEFGFDAVSLPTAVGTLVAEVAPELNRIHTHLHSDPYFGAIFRDFFPLPRGGYEPTMRYQPRGNVDTNTRDIPIAEGKQQETIRTDQPHATHLNPIESIAKSIESFSNSQ